MLAALIGVIVLAATIGALAGSAYSAPSYAVVKGRKHITMDHVFNGTFAARTRSLAWVEEGESSRVHWRTRQGGRVP